MPTNISANQVRSRLPQLLAEIAASRKRFVITRFNRPIAVMLSVEEYERLAELSDEAGDPELIAAVAEARNEYRAGQTYSIADLRHDIESGLSGDDL
jgi:prevent-host-death family protein